ncbi:RNA-binding domain-containing protein [Coniochaeta hoffmannii]|uniref:RNA-binding domain-containing protein n=1 Tax=Coniochaeta hoffmannii TaxID=91930 RepID=A0AA38R572_9PEZI|nr:RNA-binding domain-containing protein [Coniochaeta hoffmannii]
MSKHWEQNKDATVYVGNIDERFTQELLSELMTQVGPVRQVHMPQDRVSQTHQGYGFVEFDTAESADYASKVLNGIRVWGKPIRVNKASADKQKAVDIGAELFINNLDPQVDEKILYDTFSQFGQILRQPNIVRDDNNISKGYGFVSFDSFEASDAARDNMNGQYLLSKQITVEYAYKKDGKGERHGDEAERKLAAEGKKHNIVPEQQVLPPAFHMTAPGTTNVPPPGLSDPTVAATPAIPPPVAPAAGVVPHFPPSISPVGIPPPGFGAVPPPRGPAAPYIPPQMSHQPPMPTRPGGFGLPPPPSGLPARPPPSHAGFGGPVSNFHPGIPPPGGAAVPPPGFPGVPPPNGVPAGFAPPPPGFAPPGGGGVPPPGFGVPPPNGFVPHR